MRAAELPIDPASRTLRGAGLVVAATAAIYGGLSGVAWLAHDTIGSTRTIDASQLRALDLHLPSGGVRLIGTDGDAIVLERRIGRGLTEPTLDEQLSGERLVIGSRCSWFLGSACSASYTLRVPRGMPVTASADGDSIEVVGLSGTLELRSSAGDVRVAGATGASITLDSSAGDIVATGLGSARVRATSSAGDVKLSFDSPPSEVTADSSAGDVRITLPTGNDAYLVDAKTSAGSVSAPVKTDPESRRRITATSSAGDVRVRYPDGPTGG